MNLFQRTSTKAPQRSRSDSHLLCDRGLSLAKLKRTIQLENKGELSEADAQSSDSLVDIVPIVDECSSDQLTTEKASNVIGGAMKPNVIGVKESIEVNDLLDIKGVLVFNDKEVNTNDEEKENSSFDADEKTSSSGTECFMSTVQDLVHSESNTSLGNSRSNETAESGSGEEQNLDSTSEKG